MRHKHAGLTVLSCHVHKYSVHHVQFAPLHLLSLLFSTGLAKLLIWLKNMPWLGRPCHLSVRVCGSALATPAERCHFSFSGQLTTRAHLRRRAACRCFLLVSLVLFARWAKLTSILPRFSITPA